jgi:hypothetical protein
MEVTRPDPVDMAQFSVGEDRTRITQILGAPTATVKEGKLTCDSYKLYTRGPGTGGKVAIATTEVVADVFTLGLTELATTPAEYATRNSLHTVLMCYDSDGTLVSQTESQ